MEKHSEEESQKMEKVRREKMRCGESQKREDAGARKGFLSLKFPPPPFAVPLVVYTHYTSTYVQRLLWDVLTKTPLRLCLLGAAAGRRSPESLKGLDQLDH
eukprot:s4367_g3.t1